MVIKEMKFSPKKNKMILSTLMTQGMDFSWSIKKLKIVPKILTEPFLSYHVAFSIYCSYT